jgi:hypothetical protein
MHLLFRFFIILSIYYGLLCSVVLPHYYTNCYITLADFVGCGFILNVFICFCLVVCEVMDISEVLCIYIIANSANWIWISVMSKFITSSLLLHIYRYFRRNLPYFRETFFRLIYIDISNHSYIQNSMVMEIMAQ